MFGFRILLAALIAAMLATGEPARGQTPKEEVRTPTAGYVTGRVMFGAGVNSDAGITGNIILDEVSIAPKILLKLALIEYQPPPDDSNEALDPHGRTMWEGSVPDVHKLIEALSTDGRARLVAEPSLMTQSGRQATFLARVKIAGILGPKVEYRDVDVEVTATPTYSEGSFRVALQMEASELQGNSKTDPPSPIINSRRIQTTIGVKEGESALVVGPTQGKTAGDSGTFLLALITPELKGEKAPPAPVAAHGSRGKPSPTETPGAGSVPLRIEQLRGKLTIAENSSLVIEGASAWGDYRVDDRSILGAEHVEGNANQVRVVAKKAGETSLKLTDSKKNVYVLQVLATPDLRGPMQLIERLYPDARVKLIPLRNTAIVRGRVTRREHAEQITEIVSQYVPGALNHLTVEAPNAPSAPQGAIPSLTYIPQSTLPPPVAQPIPLPVMPATSTSLGDLHQEVKLLRRDVNRLIDLLEKRLDEADDPPQDAEAPNENAAKQDPRTPGVASSIPTAPFTKIVSRNFAIAAQGDTQRKPAFLRHAERMRSQLAIDWLGKALPAWSEHCELKVTEIDGPGGGATSYLFQGGSLTGMQMTVQGQPEELTNALTHEVMHTVLATHFGRPLPRWADEGIALAATPGEHGARLTEQLHQFAAKGQLLPLRDLLELTEYQQNAAIVHAQGFSLVEFLLQRSGKRKLIEFLEDGLERADWEAALRGHYGLSSYNHLEQAWRREMGLEAP